MNKKTLTISILTIIILASTLFVFLDRTQEVPPEIGVQQCIQELSQVSIKETLYKEQNHLEINRLLYQGNYYPLAYDREATLQTLTSQATQGYRTYLENTLNTNLSRCMQQANIQLREEEEILVYLYDITFEENTITIEYDLQSSTEEETTLTTQTNSIPEPTLPLLTQADEFINYYLGLEIHHDEETNQAACNQIRREQAITPNYYLDFAQEQDTYNIKEIHFEQNYFILTISNSEAELTFAVKPRVTQAFC